MMPTTRAASTPSRRVTTRASNINSSRDEGGGCGGGVGFGAAGAMPAQLVGVLQEPEFLASADGGLDPLYFAILEFDDSPASQADHMVVVMTPEHRLVARLPLGHVDPMDQPCLHQSRQRPVQGGRRNLPAAVPEVRQQIVGGKVSPDGENLLENGPARAGHLQAVAVQVAGESSGGIHDPS